MCSGHPDVRASGRPGVRACERPSVRASGRPNSGVRKVFRAHSTGKLRYMLLPNHAKVCMMVRPIKLTFSLTCNYTFGGEPFVCVNYMSQRGCTTSKFWYEGQCRVFEEGQCLLIEEGQCLVFEEGQSLCSKKDNSVCSRKDNPCV